MWSNSFVKSIYAKQNITIIIVIRSRLAGFSLADSPSPVHSIITSIVNKKKTALSTTKQAKEENEGINGISFTFFSHLKSTFKEFSES